MSLINIGTVGLVALPIIIFVFINLMHLDTIRFLWMDIPKLDVDRFQAVTNIGSSNALQTAFDNFIKGFGLLLTQDDGLIFNDIPGFGTLYLITLPFAIFGIFKKTENKEFSWIMRIALIVSLLMMFIVNPNVNRINVTYIPLIFFSIIGIYEVVSLNKYIKRATSITYLIYFFVFTFAYFGNVASSISTSFQSQYYQAIQYALSIDDAANYYITQRVNMPYIYALVVDRYDVKAYIDGVQFWNEGQSFERVKQFNNYYFWLPSKLTENNVYLCHKDDTNYKKSDYSSYKVTTFENFYVINTTL